MGKLRFDISMSLDGFVAGPNPRPDAGLGDGGEQLHEWIFGLAAWREMHGMSGGERNADSDIVEEAFAGVGAAVMGRGMFGGGGGPWGDDPWSGWWGDEPPFHMPVFVVTHHEREPVEMQGGTTFHFVTDGIESALDQAKEAAGGRDVALGGGASVAQQYMNAGLLDEMQIHLMPVVLGGGVRLFENLDPDRVKVECTRVIESPAVTHLRYRLSS